MLLTFADDTKLLKSIQTPLSQQQLQHDLNLLVSWCTLWNLNLNLQKCTVLRASLSTSNSNLAPTSYTIDNQALTVVAKQKDLGIIFTSNLSWNEHHNHICSKAYRSLNFIRRVIPSCASMLTKKQLYLTLVRSHLAYCPQIWRPHQIKNIKQLEAIQRRATKFIATNSYQLNYKSRLQQIGLLPLMYWLELQDIMFFIKCLKDPPENFNVLDYVSFVSSNTRAASTNRLALHHSYKFRYTRHFFFNRIIRLWNAIPHETFCLDNSIQTIKSKLFNHFTDYFNTNFDSNNTCTFHYCCPCTKCILI